MTCNLILWLMFTPLSLFFLPTYDCYHVKLISTLDSEISQQVQVSNSTLAVVSPQYVGTWMDDCRSSLAAWWCSSMSLYLHGPIITWQWQWLVDKQRQHTVMIILYELLMILSSTVTFPLKRVTIIMYYTYKKISSRPFCPSLSHLSAVHQPCACDCTECVEEMTCHISQHTRPTRNIKYTSQQLIYI